MPKNLPGASVVVCAYNQAKVMEKTLNAMEKLNYPDYEVVVVNDGSKDATREVLDKKFANKKLFTIIHHEKNGGLCKARNTGIAASQKEIVVMMDQDCIPEKNWLMDLVKGFDSERVGMVSSFSEDSGGTSTAFRKKVFDEVGGFDESFFFFRDDTEMVFRIKDAGYETRFVDANFQHLHQWNRPRGFIGFAKYGLKRVKYHYNDVRLYKKHPKRTKEFLDIRFGFLVNPYKDFSIATNLWSGGKMKLSSPQGIDFIEPKTPFHVAAIIAGGIAYMLAVKTARLYASVKFGKLLV